MELGHTVAQLHFWGLITQMMSGNVWSPEWPSTLWTVCLLSIHNPSSTRTEKHQPMDQQFVVSGPSKVDHKLPHEIDVPVSS